MSTAAVEAIRSALLQQVERLALGGSILSIAAEPGDALVMVTSIPTADGSVELVLACADGDGDRLLRLGFLPDERGATFVHTTILREVADPDRLARRIRAVLRFGCGAEPAARLDFEIRRLPGSTGSGSDERSGPDPLRMALERFAERPADDDAVAELAAALDCSVFFVPLADEEPTSEHASIDEAFVFAPLDGRYADGSSPAVVTTGSMALTSEVPLAIPVYTQDPCADASTEHVVVGCRDLIAWADETGTAPLLIDPAGPIPVVLDTDAIAALRSAMS
jgi:hypothetical protein